MGPDLPLSVQAASNCDVVYLEAKCCAAIARKSFTHGVDQGDAGGGFRHRIGFLCCKHGAQRKDFYRANHGRFVG